MVAAKLALPFAKVYNQLSINKNKGLPLRMIIVPMICTSQKIEMTMAMIPKIKEMTKKTG